MLLRILKRVVGPALALLVLSGILAGAIKIGWLEPAMAARIGAFLVGGAAALLALAPGAVRSQTMRGIMIAAGISA